MIFSMKGLTSGPAVSVQTVCGNENTIVGAAVWQYWLLIQFFVEVKYTLHLHFHTLKIFPYRATRGYL